MIETLTLYPLYPKDTGWRLTVKLKGHSKIEFESTDWNEIQAKKAKYLPPDTKIYNAAGELING